MCFIVAAAPTILESQSDLLYLWIRVIAFIGILGASAYFLSQYVKKKRSSGIISDNGKIVVAETHSLGNRQFLMVAQYGHEKHLLGVSPSSINHLAKLESATELKVTTDANVSKFNLAIELQKEIERPNI